MIYLGADHRGYNLKEKIKQWLTEWGYEYEDAGAFELNPEDDFVDFAKAVAEKIKNADDRGILICGLGVGMDIAANRFKNIRSGLVFNANQTEMARHSDDINVLSIGADFISEESAREIVKIFLETEFSEEERRVKRIKKLNEI